MNDPFIKSLIRSVNRSDLALPPLTHLLHRVRLHPQNLATPHPAHIKNTVPNTATTTLKNVLVLTLHPSSFPLSSHLSSFSEQISGLYMGVRRGQVAGLGTQVEDWACQQYSSGGVLRALTIAHQLQWYCEWRQE